MVDAAWTLTGRESMLGIFGRWLRRRRWRLIWPALIVFARVLMLLGACGCGVAAAWIAWGLAPGLATLAVALLLLEWAVKRR